MKFKKLGRILERKKENSWWASHCMAPTAINLSKNEILIFLGGFDKNGISRITNLIVSSSNPLDILKINSTEPVLDIGKDGHFDENGVFPGHAFEYNNEIYVSYTGFQLGHKIRYTNFGGIAKYDYNENKLTRISQAPILDRTDEGLFVRAGQSIIRNGNKYEIVYSAGSSWENIGGKLRPKYDIFHQTVDNPFEIEKKGTKILKINETEHGLGRPQIVSINECSYIFFTRRMKNMKYYFGAAKSHDMTNWKRIDNDISGINHSTVGWDSEMIYFPSFLSTEYGNYLFYSGNDFGKTGFGVAIVDQF